MDIQGNLDLQCDRTYLIKIARMFMATLLLLCDGGPAWAAQDSCEQCKYQRCLESTVERKQKLIQVYQGLQNFWQGRNLDAGGKPLTEFNLASIPESQRAGVANAYIEQLSEFAAMEKSRTEAIPPAEACGYGEEESSASTNIFTCAIEGLPKASAQQPCKELADLVAQHEGLHSQACERRKLNLRKKNQGILLTPAGKAAEEIAAYQLEISAISKIIDNLKKKCGRIATVTTPNGITYTAKRCEASQWGAWTLTVSGAMSGHGTVTVSENGGGSWSVTTTVSGVPLPVTQTGRAEYISQPQPILRLTTNAASVAGVTREPNKSIDLNISFTTQCP